MAALLSTAYDAVLALANLIVPIVGTPGFALSIVCLTVLVRSAIAPLSISLAKAEAARRRLAPQLDALRRRFSKDPARLQRESLELYRREGVSPIGGILPVLAQAPVLGLVYGLVTQPLIGGHGNELMTHVLGGAPLGSGILSGLASGASALAWPAILVNLALFAAMIAVAELSRRQARRRLAATPPVSRPTSAPGVDPARLAQRLTWLSYGSAIVSLLVPLAAAIYLCASAAWTLGERHVLNRRFGGPAPA